MKILFGLMLIVSISCSGFAEESVAPKVSDFHGFVCNDYEHDGLSYKIVVPKQEAKGKPWIWRARFFGHEPQLDKALLELGYHVVYCDVADLFGSPKAVARWDQMYRMLVEERGFHKKAALEGMSRGGLII